MSGGIDRLAYCSGVVVLLRCRLLRGGDVLRKLTFALEVVFL
jgi:hypothetical protein